MTHAPAIAVLGLGEVGSAIAADLARAAVEGTDVVLSLTSASAALELAEAVAPALAEGSLFADLNTAAPALKRELAAVVEERGARFADVALLRAVSDWGMGTPSLVSGPGAEEFAGTFRRLGMPVTVLGSAAGDAAARKLARSVFMKGLAATVGEALAAGERLGCEDWLKPDIEATLTGADAHLLRRLIEGSRTHAARRVEEMAAAVAMLEELGVEPRVAAASEAWLRSLEERAVRR